MKQLTKNEMAVWKLTSENITSAEIARRLNRTLKSVDSAKARIKSKLPSVPSDTNLNDSQAHILKLLNIGCKPKYIATKVGVSTNVVYNTKYKLKEKGLLGTIQPSSNVNTTVTSVPKIVEPTGDDWGSMDDSFKYERPKATKTTPKPTNIGTKATKKTTAVKNLPLSKREKQVQSLVNKGLSTKEIASKLKISVNNVYNVSHNVRKKLGSGATNKPTNVKPTTVKTTTDNTTSPTSTTRNWKSVLYTIVQSDGSVINTLSSDSINSYIGCSKHVVREHFENTDLPIEINGHKIYSSKDYNKIITTNSEFPPTNKLPSRITGNYVIQCANGTVKLGLTEKDLYHDNFIDLDTLNQKVASCGYPVDISGYTVYDTETFNKLKFTGNLTKAIPNTEVKKVGFFKRLFGNA